MTDAELHRALREVVAIGRRGGYDNDEIAEKLALVVHQYANDTLTGLTEFLAAAKREDWQRWMDLAKSHDDGHRDDKERAACGCGPEQV